jgi:hypothetical protein
MPSNKKEFTLLRKILTIINANKDMLGGQKAFELME